MQDRVSRNPGRVLITPEDGSTPFYAIMTRADNPEVEGTKINKNALLKDATAALFGLDADAVPDDALAAIKNLIDQTNDEVATAPKIVTGSYTGNGKYGSSGNANKITVPFQPQLVLIFASDMGYLFGADDYLSSYSYTILAARPAKSSVSRMDVGIGNVQTTLNYTWGSNSFSWYASAKKSSTDYTSANSQLNVSGTTYYYIAFGI